MIGKTTFAYFKPRIAAANYRRDLQQLPSIVSWRADWDYRDNTYLLPRLVNSEDLCLIRLPKDCGPTTVDTAGEKFAHKEIP